MTEFPKAITIGPAISIELVQQDGLFLGLGSIKNAGTVLRSDRRPMFVEIRNPSGIELLNYSLLDCVETPTETRLKFAMERREGGNMEWMVHEVRPRYNTSDWTSRPQAAEDTTLELELRPVSRKIGDRAYSGFSYRYHYRSGSIPIYKILDRSTWEVGGSALGIEFWMRNCFVPPIVRVDSAERFYSSEWFIANCANPNAFQFAPFQTELQGFTFTPSKAGLLITWANEVRHIRSLFEKPRESELLVHFHEHCGDLAYEVSTAPMEVLWGAGERERVDLANDYEAVRELVHETLHAQIGMRRERVSTYGMIEEWGSADLDRYRRLGLTKLVDAGVKTVFLSNHFENNMNTWGVGNMCCTVDLKVAESVGADKLQALCRDAREAGTTIEMWGNTAISTLTPIFKHHDGSTGRIKFLPLADSIMEAINEKSGFVRNPSNAIEADHYTPVFATLNLRDEAVRGYWLKRWGAAHDEIGLGGIFLDSSFNMSSDKFHYVQNTEADRIGATADQSDLLGNYRPEKEFPQAILSQYLAHLDLMVEMQKAGYVYCNEDLGVFGIHRHGPGLSLRLGNLFLWTDCVANFEPAVATAAGANPEDVYFQGLAYRMVWIIYWDIQRDALSFNFEGKEGHAQPDPWHLQLLKAYNEVEGFMLNRRILEGETGVLYQGGGKQILWAFQDFELALEHPSSVVDVLAGNTVQASSVQARRNQVYIISPAK